MQQGTAALHLAAELGHEEVIDILLANNAFVNVRNKVRGDDCVKQGTRVIYSILNLYNRETPTGSTV